jgi:hypothetical protein
VPANHRATPLKRLVSNYFSHESILKLGGKPSSGVRLAAETYDRSAGFFAWDCFLADFRNSDHLSSALHCTASGMVGNFLGGSTILVLVISGSTYACFGKRR